MVAILQRDPVRDPDQPLIEFASTLFGDRIELGFVVALIEKLKEQPALVLAIEAWDAECNLVEDAPQADGLLGTAATEAKRLAKALSRVLYPGDGKGEQE